MKSTFAIAVAGPPHTGGISKRSQLRERLLRVLGTTLVASTMSLGFLLAPPATATAVAATPPSADNIVKDTNGPTIAEVYREINLFRASKELRPVLFNAKISEQLAQPWNDHMAATDTFEHNTGSWSAQLEPSLHNYNGAGEIIAARWDRDAKALVQQWIDSPPHNAIMSSPDMNMIGLGITYTNGNPQTDPNRYVMYGTVNFFKYQGHVPGTYANPSEFFAGQPQKAPVPAGMVDVCNTAPNGAVVCFQFTEQAPPEPEPEPTAEPEPEPEPTMPPAPKQEPEPTFDQTPRPKPVKSPSIKSGADVVAISTRGQLWNYSSSGKTKLNNRVLIGRSGWQSMKDINVADWNDDGIQDMVATHKNGKLYVYKGKSTGGFHSRIEIGGSGWQRMDITIGEFYKGNAYPQIVGRDLKNGKMYVYENNNGNSLGSRIVIGNSGWSKFNKISMVDWDRDGNQDIVANNSRGQLKLYRTAGSGKFISESRKTVGSGGWNGVRDINIVPGFAGKDSIGFAARTSNSQLRYYPIVDGRHGSPKTIGTSGWNSYRLAR